MTDNAPAQTGLRRSISVLPLALYGIGVTVGAGIYVLVGEVARVAGHAAPLSFLLAALVIAPTAFSFAELAVRFPRSAGEALYIKEAFQSLALARVVGLLVATAGIVSSAAVAIGAAGYLRQFIDMPVPVIALVVILLLGAIAAWGVVQSVIFAVAISILEVGALLYIVAIAAPTISEPLARLPEMVPAGLEGWTGIVSGILLAFFAFIGFEDLVNMAEEVKDPGRTLPIAIITTLLATVLIYMAVVFVAVNAMTPADLAQSSAPLASLYARITGGNPALISAIAVASTANTVLIQMVMATRVLYGMAREGALPATLGIVSARTQTPLRATALTIILVLALALLLPIETLARATSAIVLGIFVLVNLSLIRIKRRGGDHTGFKVPGWIPLAGAIVSALVFTLEMIRLLAQ